MDIRQDRWEEEGPYPSLPILPVVLFLLLATAHQACWAPRPTGSQENPRFLPAKYEIINCLGVPGHGE